MALILIRGDNKTKVFNAIEDVEKHADLNIISNPKTLDSKVADKFVSKILNADLKTVSKVAAAFLIEENPTVAISKIRSIHPPAHITVVSDEYKVYEELLEILYSSSNFNGLNYKVSNTHTIDYKQTKTIDY
ncbi:DUF356 domain-containing protein [uncultured Methanobrevibacter sp.]|uniref:DUF356 domain-containing protein n=1 Tax=uncultured Methanobrevibacter sp. TaxID=253161 RepID=UPI0025CD2BEF|nr:DUF356 domain-containing protein [uncultured Methanobrevibacter sp.]